MKSTTQVWKNKIKSKKLGINLELPNDVSLNRKKVRELTAEEEKWTENIEFSTSDPLINTSESDKKEA
jgi:hypothetical protein